MNTETTRFQINPPGMARRAAVLFAALAAFTAMPAAAEAATFRSQTPISVPQAGQASPYPSALQVSGQRGPLQDVTVTLHNVSHQTPQDLDILLTTPAGYRVKLASDACGDQDVVNRTWIFTTLGEADGMPEENCSNSAIFSATDFSKGATDSWPGTPTGGELPFDFVTGPSPNGQWTLRVVDDAATGSGQIAGGWTLEIETKPVDVHIPAAPDAQGPANRYPISRTFTTEPAVLTDVDVGVLASHLRPDDLDLLVVGPGGQKVLLMNDACGDSDVFGQVWGFDDEATRPMPDGGAGSVCPGANYKPTDHTPGGSLPAPAPAGPYSTSLSDFDGTRLDGEWTLYVNDDEVGQDGWIESPNSFSLVVGLRPLADVKFSAGARIAEAGRAELELVRAGPANAVLGPATVRVRTAAGTATAGSDFEAVDRTVEFARGETTRTIPVRAFADSDGDEGDETFDVQVTDAQGDAKAAPGVATVTIANGGIAGGGVPETTIDKGPKKRSRSARARVRFSSATSGAGFECQIDKKPFRVCGSPSRVKRLKKGKHRFAVRAVDAAGVADPTPAEHRWRVTRQ